ncbi:MAG: SDR family NAD(P)-dependent oxidoreductase [Candidatus Sericytochromatia bacterium]|nr:SDR family NAD(P)-dependent oxidoreductase [Candidatus Sericytochromatia bacterium]
MRKVLITGGASGLGYALAQAYQTRGCQITVLDCQPPPPELKCHYLPLNLANLSPEQMPVMETCFDLVICNAGISLSGKFTELDFAAEKNVMEINCLGHMQLLKGLLQQNAIQPGGQIAFVCSATAFLPFPIALAYAASKGALDGFAQALEAYLIPQKIAISRIYPGPMQTPHTRYYPVLGSRKGRDPTQSVPAIMRGLARRRRKILPDPVSRWLWLGSFVFPGLLARKAYQTYRDFLN